MNRSTDISSNIRAGRDACAPRRRRIFASWLALSLAALAGCGERPAATAPELPPVPVELAPVRYSDAAVPVRVPGVLSRKEESDLAFKIGGIVEAVNVRAGDTVTRGQVLAQLRLEEIDAQLAQARSALAKAERDLSRLERLQANSVATLENLQDAQTDVDVAAAQVRIAEFNRRFAVITAPADGQILRREVEPNELVAAGKVVLAFAASDAGWLVRAGVADADRSRLQVGDRALIERSGTAEPLGSGRIAHIPGEANPATRTTLVEIVLDEPPARAHSGLAVSAILLPEPVAARPVVPASALIEGHGTEASLFLVKPGRDLARRERVEIEAIDGADAYLRTPLTAGDRLVIRGGEYLRDGARVAPSAP